MLLACDKSPGQNGFAGSPACRAGVESSGRAPFYDDADGSFVPHLATGFTENAARTRFTDHPRRRDLLNGEALDAAAVAANLNFWPGAMRSAVFRGRSTFSPTTMGRPSPSAAHRGGSTHRTVR